MKAIIGMYKVLHNENMTVRYFYLQCQQTTTWQQ